MFYGNGDFVRLLWFYPLLRDAAVAHVPQICHSTESGDYRKSILALCAADHSHSPISGPAIDSLPPEWNDLQRQPHLWIHGKYPPLF